MHRDINEVDKGYQPRKYLVGYDNWSPLADSRNISTGNFSLHHRIQNGSGTHTASYPTGTRGSFPGGKASGREADHSPPSSAEVKECVEL